MSDHSLNFNLESKAQQKFGVIGTTWDVSAVISPSGQRFMPESVRSLLVHPWHHVRDNKIFDIESMRVIDLNDMQVKDFGNIDDYLVDDWQYSRDKITEGVSNVVTEGYTPVVIGGDCSIHFPAFKGIHDTCGGKLGVVYMDAHCDFYDDTPKYGHFSHGHPLGNIMKLPRVDGKNVVNFGIRMYEKPEFYDYIREHGTTPITPNMFHKMGVEETAKKILSVVKDGTEKAVLCIDIDVMEGAIAPGTSGNETGGFLSYEFQELCKLLAPHIDAVIITEVNVLFDVNTLTSGLVAKLLNDYMFYRYAALTGQK